jgi:hypothetical protein
MISNLHIRAGQPVVVFMLGKKSSSYQESSCYPNAYYDPCYLPFYGEYNDYGAVEKCHGIGVDYVVEALRKNLVEMDQGSNPYHDPPAKKETFNIDQLFELDHEGRLLVANTHGESRYLKAFLEMARSNLTKEQIESIEANIERQGVKYMGQQVTHVQIHGDVFDYIIKNFKIEEHYHNARNQFASRYYGFDDVLADLPAYIDKVNEKLKEVEDMKAGDASELRMAVWMLRSEMSDLFPWDTTNRAARFLRFGEGSESSSRFLVNGKELIISEATKLSPEKYRELLTDLLKGQWIATFMSYTRRCWFKPTGEGSQNDELSGHQTLVNAVQSVLDKEKGEHEQYEEEEKEFMAEYEAKEQAKKDARNTRRREARAKKKATAK